MVKTIEFVVRSRMGAIKNGVISGGDNNASIDLTAGGDISLNVTQTDVLGYVREGRDLHITMADGRVVTIKGYFGGSGPVNRLFLSTDGDITMVAMTEGPGNSVVPSYGRTETWGKWSPNDALTFLGASDTADDIAGMGPFTPAVLGAVGGGGLGAAAAVIGGAALIGTAGGGGAQTRPSEPTEPTEPTDPTAPTDPTDPTDPTVPTDPTDPTDPTAPTDPTDPTDPTVPTDPTDPTDPTVPTDPTDPTDPTVPTDPTDPTDPTAPTDPTDPTDPTVPTD
ncbi:MAG: hypothetical protein Q8K20_02315, partial [Gemmobacter sp.]|nr:hypothetical protein [Gemmobacter sp.]